MYALNTGRITLPAACAGLARKCLDVTLDWANAREQWGAPIGKHAAIADKIARMAAGLVKAPKRIPVVAVTGE